MFQAIFRICLLRGSPADVNASIITITTFAVLLIALAWMGGGGIGTTRGLELSTEELNAVQRVITAIPLLQHTFATLMFFTVLNIRQFVGRFAQTLTTYLGVQVVFQAGVVGVSVLSTLFPSGLILLFGALQLTLQIWFFAVMGHVYRHAFSIKMYQGVLAAIVIIFLSYFLAGITAGLLFPDSMLALVKLGQTELTPIESN